MRKFAPQLSTVVQRDDLTSRNYSLLLFLLLLLSLGSWSFPAFPALLAEHISLVLLGISGAIFANSTGAGGGVVFIPVFHHFGLSESQSIATSFGIQCFGMTAGAITWCYYHRKQSKIQRINWRSFKQIIFLGASFSVAGIWSVYAIDYSAPGALHELFSLFSIFLGVAILGTLYLLGQGKTSNSLSGIDIVMIAGIAYGGGMITAWLSVGVGELIAIYLILRRFEVTMSIAAAVVISALSVWSAAPQHVLFDPQINWKIVAFAGPGAIIGGILARSLVGHLSARSVKTFFGVWLLVIGFFG